MHIDPHAITPSQDGGAHSHSTYYIDDAGYLPLMHN